MERIDIIGLIGKEFLTSNIENSEFSYEKALKAIGKNYLDYLDKDCAIKHKNLDLRFSNERLSILVETKADISKNLKKNLKQLQSYLNMERALTDNKVIAVLASTNNSLIRIYYGIDFSISEDDFQKEEIRLKSFLEYEDIYFGVKNNKLEIIKNTYKLNELLHKYGIKERIRSQFVGTCLLALKHGLVYSLPKDKEEVIKDNGVESKKVIRKETIKNSQIRTGIKDILEELLEQDLNKAEKIVILKKNVIDSQDIIDLDVQDFQNILRKIENGILPFINEKNTLGQDLLNLFFTTFNKYVGKADKNQAFTPDHIVKFMCEIAGINRNSRILDPCCGSGAFLVRALTTALDDCSTDKEKEIVKKKHIYGIEFEEIAYGLATTNMLIHGDGNSNISKDNMFNKDDDYFDEGKFDVILMNPPYNAHKKHSDPNYTKKWGDKTTTDPSKGFHFVYHIAKKVKKGKLAVLLPTSCAIGNKKYSDITSFKEKMLQENTLLAVFSLPPDIFHPGATASACCMLFELGVRHERANINGTFFGYYKNDGFVKKRNLGRIEKIENGESEWEKQYDIWLKLFNEKIEKAGYSVIKKVTHNDEWLAEAYMETDYSNLTESDFEKTIRDFISFKIKTGEI
jgi:RM-cspCI